MKSRSATSRRTVWTAIVVATIALGAAAVGVHLRARNPLPKEVKESTAPVDLSAGAGSSIHGTGNSESEPAIANRAMRGATREASVIAPDGPRARPRSPLERSPGYYPPADPESLSVVTGRRDAALVSLELTNGAASMQDLARMLLAGLNARDESALHALRVTRQEFDVILWREFPESRPVTNITVADAWEMSNIQAASGASRAVGGFGGRVLDLLRIESGPTEQYRNFKLHRDTVIVARDHNTGEIETMRFAPTFVERHGRFKVLTYKD